MLLLLLPSIFLWQQCVPARKLEDEKAKTQKLTSENIALTEKLNGNKKKLESLQENVNRLQKTVKMLSLDTSNCSEMYRKTLKRNKELNDLYEKIINQNENLVSIAANERARLSKELEDKKHELEVKQKELEDKSKDLITREAQLNEKEKQNEALQSNLAEREQKVKELQTLVSRKDSFVLALKNNLSKALLNFNDEELSINIRDGKIYVSLSEQLLFKSGSISVDKKGQDALKKLAKALKEENDITIYVEGHTDNVPIHTGCIKDNWDLSVLRATSIVRILLSDNNIEPSRIIPSGRGESLPVADNKTKEGRSENRRTEIIIAPDLSKVFDLLKP